VPDFEGTAVIEAPLWSNCQNRAIGECESCSGRALLRNYTADYETEGAGKPLILVPGLAGGIELLKPLARCLARHFRVIRFELRGEDDCFAVRRQFGIEDLADDLAEFVDSLGVEMPLVMGVSFGGAVALEFSVRHRYRLCGLVVQGADVRFKRTTVRQVAGEILSGYPLPPDNPFVNQFFNLLFGGRQKDRDLFEFVTRQCWRTDQSVMAHRFRLAEELDLGMRLRDLQAPTLLLRGTKDLLVSKDGWEEMSASIFGAKGAEINGAGHLACVTHPEQMAEEVCRFARNEGLLTD
jgi:3-oxoadipate enol-lactonase